MSVEILVPIITSMIAASALIWTAYINRQNKPVREVLKKTKIQGDGSLVEAIGILQKEYVESQERHSREIKYFTDQLTATRSENISLRSELAERDKIIDRHEIEIGDLKRRLGEAHIGKNRTPIN